MVRAWALAGLLAAPAPGVAQSGAVDASATGRDETGDYAPFPRPGAGYVTDLAGLLGPADEERIERWLWQVEEQTGVEIVVVTINALADFPGTPNGSIESFATALFDRYGIGNMPKNDGVLLLVARADREARIELGEGYGGSRDFDAARIMASVIVPAFREGDYRVGIADGVKAIALEFADARIGPPWLLIGLAVSIPILALVAFSLFRSGKKGWGWIVVGLLIIVVLLVIFLAVRLVRALPEGDSDSWASGGFGGGFGGGSSGGGGATGSW